MLLRTRRFVNQPHGKGLAQDLDPGTPMFRSGHTSQPLSRRAATPSETRRRPQWPDLRVVEAHLASKGAEERAKECGAGLTNGSGPRTGLLDQVRRTLESMMDHIPADHRSSERHLVSVLDIAHHIASACRRGTDPPPLEQTYNSPLLLDLPRRPVRTLLALGTKLDQLVAALALASNIEPRRRPRRLLGISAAII